VGFSDDVEGLLYARNSFFKLALACADLPDHHEDLAVAFVLFAHDLFVHLVGLLQERKSVFVVASLHIAVSKQSQNVGVILLRSFNLREEGTVKLQCSGQMIKSLLKVGSSQVRLAQLCIRCHKHEEILSMYVHK